MQRHGISRLPEIEGDKPEKKRFEPYPIGYFHIDIAQVSTEEGKPWSNGQTEGQITRLELVRRQTYGRAKLDLL